MNIKLGGKLKEWLRGTRDVAAINKHLPSGVRARRGKPGHVQVEGHGLSYQFDRSRFASHEEMAAFAASKIPRS